MIRATAFIICLLASFSLTAQLTYGFKTGLNFANIDGPSETDMNGNSTESWESLLGFHIGVSVGYRFNEYFSVRGEMLYSRKGGEYAFEGKGYRFFREDQQSTLSFGDARYALQVNNSYLDIPIVAAGRWKRLEIAGGVYGAILLQSIAEGSHVYTNGVTSLGNPIDSIRYTLDYNYRTDTPGGADQSEFFEVAVDNRLITQPSTIGAYFDHLEDNGSLYSPFDFGLIGELNYFFNSTLYLGGRIQYGLVDITRNEADLSKANLNSDNTLLFRDDKDRNFTIQASVGFTF